MLYLMRHGETDWNAVQRIQGHSDIPLNENGVRTMTEAGKRLKELGFHVDRIAVSPLRRAGQTARIIGEAIGYTGEYLRDDDLIERSFGSAEGLSLLDHPDLSDETYGVEPLEHLRQRVETVLRRYRSDEEHDWLLVTHGAFMMAAMDLLLDRPQDEGYLSLPPQGNPLQVLERDGKAALAYLLPEGQQMGKAGQKR